MKTVEIFEAMEEKLSGFLDIKAVARLLPGITDFAKFESAILKLRNGQQEYFIYPEEEQLAKAFTSLLGLGPQQKSNLFRLLMASKATQQIAEPDSGTETPNQV